MAAEISYKKSGTRHIKQVIDGDNSIKMYVDADDTTFFGIGVTEEDTFGYDTISEGDWNDLLDSYNDALVYALEFVGGHPPHFPIPTRPK